MIALSLAPFERLLVPPLELELSSGYFEASVQNVFFKTITALPVSLPQALERLCYKLA
jgi:hypothetical protein